MKLHVKALCPDSISIQLEKSSATNLPEEVEYGTEEYSSALLISYDEDYSLKMHLCAILF